MNRIKNAYQDAYLCKQSPLERSGFAHDLDSFLNLRSPILIAMGEKEGRFLDLGCANGVLIELLSKNEGVRREYFGIDFVPELIEEANSRLGEICHVADLHNYVNTTGFEFVRFELCYAREHKMKYLVEHVIESMLCDDGVALICNYSEEHPQVAKTVFEGYPAIESLQSTLTELGYRDFDLFWGECSKINRKSCVAKLEKHHRQWQINQVDPSKVRTLRHRILRPLQSLQDCHYQFDEDEQSIHLELCENGQQLGVLSALNEDGVMRLRGMAVIEQARSTGVGQLLLMSLKRRLLSREMNHLWCNARETALKFYTSLGWESEGGPFEIPGIGSHWRMNWNLKG